MSRAGRIYMLVTIVERGKGIKLMQKYEQFKIIHHVQAAGRGTAKSHLTDALGFATGERDVIFSFGPRDTVNQVMFYLRDDDRETFDAPGVAMSAALNGMAALWAAGLNRLEEVDLEKGEILMEQGFNHSLIFVVLNQGYSDAVMDTAREMGASGGTVIRGRWAGAGATQKFAGISIQEEKEILMILSSDRTKDKIMSEINRIHGIKSSAQAMVFSVPTEHVARVS